nr:hypothetical protein [Tanacetum cinerariifolium]
RSFAAIINKCLGGKTIALKVFICHVLNSFGYVSKQENIDYVYLLWEDLVFQVKNENSKKNNDMYYPRFTKVIVYGALLPQHLTNQAMLDSGAYKTYHAYATGEKIPKPKYVQKRADSDTSPKKKPAQAPKGKQIKAAAKVPKSRKKKLPTIGLE